jgi:hypothetical protein
VKAVSDEGKKEFKTNKQVKQQLPFLTFIQIMRKDLQGIYKIFTNIYIQVFHRFHKTPHCNVLAKEYQPRYVQTVQSL